MYDVTIGKITSDQPKHRSYKDADEYWIQNLINIIYFLNK